MSVDSDFDAVRRPIEEARSLPAEAYTTERFLDLERRTLFSHRWICIGLVDDVPERGAATPREVAGKSVIMTPRYGGRRPCISQLLPASRPEDPHRSGARTVALHLPVPSSLPPIDRRALPDSGALSELNPVHPQGRIPVPYQPNRPDSDRVMASGKW